MTFQFRTNEATGTVCCSSTNAAGETVAPLHPCEKCAAHFAALELRTTDSEGTSAAPDIYAEPLKAMRAASDTSSPFEKQFRAARIEALAEEHAAHVARGDDNYRFATLSAVDLSPYTPPDPYQIALQGAKR